MTELHCSRYWLGDPCTSFLFFAGMKLDYIFQPRLCLRVITFVTWNPLGRQHRGGIRHTRVYRGWWALWTRNGRRSKSRQGEPSTHDADQTNEKGERKTGLWVRRTSDCSAALRKFGAAQCEVLAQRLPVDRLCTGQQCPGPCILTVLSHWLGPAWENGLSSNVGIDNKGAAAGGHQLTELLLGASVLEGDMRSTSPWLPHHTTELSRMEHDRKGCVSILDIIYRNVLRVFPPSRAWGKIRMATQEAICGGQHRVRWRNSKPLIHHLDESHPLWKHVLLDFRQARNELLLCYNIEISGFVYYDS